MNRWSTTEHDIVENKRVDAFLDEIEKVCKKHGMVIGHEDQNGSFLVKKFNVDDMDILKDANDATDEDPGFEGFNE